jgi:glycosyltransferase involved in cell wall biosynthesis
MPKSDIKIAYVIGAPFPTMKAYGVTSRETINVLLNNKVRTKVFCLNGQYYDSDYKNILKDITEFTKNIASQLLITLGSMGSSKLNFFCWRLGIAKIINKNLGLIKDYDPELIWVRDPMIAYLYLKNFKSVNIILEVHDKSGIFFHKKLIKYNARVSYFPINQTNSDFLLNLNSKANSKIAPMGIRDENLASKNDCVEFTNSLKRRYNKSISIGYIGKIAPGGYSKGTEDLIELAKYAQSNKLNLYVTLVGATEIDLPKINIIRKELAIRKNFLSFKMHVKHTEALSLMKSFDILILPAYSSDRYIGMPLKLLEYLSTGKITIMADIPLYKNIFKQNFRPFFYTPGDIDSLIKSIYSALEKNNLNDHLVKGVNFASEFTWTNRTLMMLAKTKLKTNIHGKFKTKIVN